MKKIYYSFIIAGFSLLTLFSCSSNTEKKEKKTKPKKIALISVKKPIKKDISASLYIIGSIKPNTVGIVKTSTDGIVENLKARETQFVKKGDIVAVINPTARIELVAKSLNKINSLEAELKITNHIDSIQSLLDKAKQELKLAKNMYQLIPITAELSGIVNERYVDIGSQVSVKDKIIEISDPSSMVIKAEVNEKYFPTLKKGKQLPIILSAYPNKQLSGEISLIYPKIDDRTRTVRFDIKLKDKVKILEGMTAKIMLVTEQHKNALCVPNDAILSDIRNQAFIFIVDKNNLAHKIIVKPGLTANGITEIKEGISENMKIVVKGQERLKEGKKAKILTPKKKEK